MIPPYEVFLRSEAIDSLRAVRINQRKFISKFIDSLAFDHFLEGDYAVKDSSGRNIQIKIVSEHAVTFGLTIQPRK